MIKLITNEKKYLPIKGGDLIVTTDDRVGIVHYNNKGYKDEVDITILYGAGTGPYTIRLFTKHLKHFNESLLITNE